MTDPLPRPVPRWLRVWAVLTVATTLVLVAIGQMVTSFQAGMADPVWPTEPWYVLSTASETEKARYKQDFGFFIEHTHRMAGFTVGALASALALGLWWSEPRSKAKWVALGGIVVLLAGYGQFHGALIAQRNVPTEETRVPVGASAVTLAGLTVALAVGVSGLASGVRGAGLRLLGTVALAGVMVQGLLGGFRVKLNAWVGFDLALFHGAFAQVVIGLLVTIAALTRRREVAETQDRSRALFRWSVVLAVVLFTQLVWGARISHDISHTHTPSPLVLRLHLLTAFAAAVLGVWVLRAVFADRAARARVGPFAWLFALLLAVQLYFGVEAWLAKFGAYTLPYLVPLTITNGAIRTLHALVGSCLWATSVALVLRLWQPTRAPAHTLEQVQSARVEARTHATTAV